MDNLLPISGLLFQHKLSLIAENKYKTRKRGNTSKKVETNLA